MSGIRTAAMILLAMWALLAATACSKQDEPAEEVPEQHRDANIEVEDPEVTDSPGSNQSEEEEDANGEKELSVQLVRQYENVTFTQPVGMAVHPADVAGLYLIEREGRIVRMDREASEPSKEIFLDITDRVYDQGMEQGLLGVAFHPDYEQHPYFYVNYTTSTHTVIARYEDPYADAGFSSDTLQPAAAASEQIVLTYRQPYSNHNGGDLKFGPDGYLYISSGDGGSAGDPEGNAQNVRTLLGKLLRIDVNHEDDGKRYAIPDDNPFARLSDDARPEIYAYGLRNPWRFSFDAKTGELWAADVGQDEVEEINIIENGGNYGWKIKEGTSCYRADTCSHEGFIDPIYEYDHSLGASITGGYVYRGERMPELKGRYVYADFISGRIWALKRTDEGETINTLLLHTDLPIASFGVDAKEELYVLTLEGEVYLMADA